MSDPNAPRPELHEAIAMLKGHPALEAIIASIADEREAMIGRFASCVNDGEAMKTAGGVAAIDRILGSLQG
jgi:hypothetical protein